MDRPTPLERSFFGKARTIATLRLNSQFSQLSLMVSSAAWPAYHCCQSRWRQLVGSHAAPSLSHGTSSRHPLTLKMSTCPKINQTQYESCEGTDAMGFSRATPTPWRTMHTLVFPDFPFHAAATRLRRTVPPNPFTFIFQKRTLLRKPATEYLRTYTSLL